MYMGAGQPQRAKLVGLKSIYLGVVVSVFCTAILFIVSEYLPRWLTPDPTLQRMIFELLPLIGFGQILMAVGTICWSVIAAQGRVRLATGIEFISSWFFVIPISAIFVYGFNYNLLGSVAAVVFGYTIGGVANAYLILLSNWEAFSAIVIARNAAEGLKWHRRRLCHNIVPQP
jgi:Na+-driven multidrug efflux pump